MRRSYATILTVLLVLLPVLVAAQEQAGADREAVIQQARSLKNLYKTDEAVDLLSSLVADGAFDEQVLSELADCHYQDGGWEDAAGAYFLLSQAVPDKIFYKIRLMQCFYRLKGYAQAAEIGKERSALDSIPAILSLTGDSFNQLEQYDSALVWYNKSLSIKPMNESVVNKAARIHLDRKDFDSAIAVADSLLVHDPDNMLIAPIKGMALYRKGEYDAAIDVLERQRSIGNDSYGVHFYLGQCYWQTNTVYRAQEELQAAWQIDSSDVNLAYSIAAVNMDAFMPFGQEVAPWLDKALKMLEPDHVMLARIHQQYGLGYYNEQNSWTKAIEHYKEAYRNNPKLISAMSTIGYCYEQMKDYRSAREWYEKYLKAAKPGSKGYNFVEQSLTYINAELFMDEGK